MLPLRASPGAAIPPLLPAFPNESKGFMMIQVRDDWEGRGGMSTVARRLK